MFYIYDSYHNSGAEWKELLSPSGMITVRGTSLDAIFIALLVESRHKEEILKVASDDLHSFF